MINGLDLFSGIGGNTLGLDGYVRTVAYCEQDRHAQSVLLSRMLDGGIRPAPIWDDITTLTGDMLPPIDIIVGGFPCQDISVAGKGAGLEGERSGLFFEIIRLAKEIKPTFLFLENVPAIRTRGLDTVVRSLSDLGYDCRWTSLSAAEVGAPHKRERWFLLATYSGCVELRIEQGRSSRESGQGAAEPGINGPKESMADAWSASNGRECDASLEGPGDSKTGRNTPPLGESDSNETRKLRGASIQAGRGADASWWALESDVGRVAHGVSLRVDRLRRLGNAVVPLQAREAFEELMGIK